MEKEQSDEQSYDELYNQGFDEQNTEVKAHEEKEEVIEEDNIEEDIDTSKEQPTEEEESEEKKESKEESEEDESKEEDTTEEKDSDSVEEEIYTITIGGQEVNLTIDEMKIFAQKGGDYTRKTQDLAKNRADVELMIEKGLSREDLVMIADIKSGNKEAFAVLAKQAGIDPVEVEEDSTYKPEVVNHNYELNDIISDIRNDSVNGNTIDNWVAALPNSARSSFADNPAILKGLHIDTVNGVSKEIMPEVIKQLAMNPNADFVQVYQSVGQAYVNRKAETKEKEIKTVSKKPEAKRETKQRANISKTKTTHLKDHQDIWEDDELYESMKKKLADMK